MGEPFHAIGLMAPHMRGLQDHMHVVQGMSYLLASFTHVHALPDSKLK